MPLKTAIVIPTYNERENVRRMVEALFALELGADVRFIDDGSPDGTGDVLDELCGRYPRLSVHHRRAKDGIGSAHRDGIAWAYANSYERLVTLDCDFSHSPQDVPVILEAALDADVAVGSRWQSPNSLSEWNLFRRLMTGGGHAMTRVVLGLPYDATGAFRAYRLDRIPEATFALVHANSYGFFFESLFVLHVNGFRVREIPIILPARTYGHSKMTMAAALHSVRFMLGIAARYRRHPDAFRLKASSNRQEPTSV